MRIFDNRADDDYYFELPNNHPFVNTPEENFTIPDGIMWYDQDPSWFHSNYDFSAEHNDTSGWKFAGKKDELQRLINDFIQENIEIKPYKEMR